MITVKYIDDNMEKGIDYDYAKIVKEFEKLKCPKDVYNPIPTFVSGARHHVILSERSTGKTTNVILLGMVMNELYGTVFHYIRQTEQMTAPKILGEMLSVINKYGYPTKITHGRWNYVKYWNRRFYYINIDEDGNEIEKCATHIGYAMSIDKDLEYKSGYNCPTGDIAIFDEFVTPDNSYRPNEFVLFMDILKTVFRDRECCHVFWCANTVNRHSTYFSELGIHSEIVKMNIGDTRKFETEEGTSIYVELLGNKIADRRKKVNKQLFGFSNPLLASIKGGNWAIDTYPHIEHDDTREILLRNVYIEFNSNYIELELAVNETMGLHVLCHKSTRKPRRQAECLYYTFVREHQQKWYKFCFGRDKLSMLIWDLFEENKFLYADNETGDIINSFIGQAKLEREFI